MRRGLICGAVVMMAVCWTFAPADPAAAACERGRAEGMQAAVTVPWERAWLDLDRAWSLAGSRAVTVAVVDTGVDVRHPQLAGAVLAGTDLVDAGDGRVDCTGHGTGVASLIAAAPAAGVGFAGVAPGTRILPVRVAERIDDLDPARVAAGVDWAVGRGAQILVMAYTLPADAAPVRAAVARAVGKGALVVASGGSVRGDRLGAGAPVPAAYPGVLGVSAVDGTGAVEAAVLAGEHVDLAAPGIAVTTAAPRRGHTVHSGADMAAAITAGVAALLLSTGIAPSAEAVAARLAATADPTPGGARSPAYGAGVVNPVRALSEPVSGTGRAEPGMRLPAAAQRNEPGGSRGAAVAAVLGAVTLFVGVAAGLRRAVRRSRAQG